MLIVSDIAYTCLEHIYLFLMVSLLTLVPSFLKYIGLPPISFLIRSVRPYAFTIIVFMWLTLRLSPLANSFLNFSETLPTGLLTATLITFDNVYKLSETAKLLLDDILGYLLLYQIFHPILHLRRYSPKLMMLKFIDRGIRWSQKHIPKIREAMEKEKTKLRRDIELKKYPDKVKHTTLPQDGLSNESILALLRKNANVENSIWKTGQISGSVYGANDKMIRLASEVFQMYCYSNPLHPGIWPTINQMEAEICSMTGSLLNGGNESVVGSMSSGGTESIVLAVRSSLVYFGHNNGIERPEIICSLTAHAAIFKACEIMGIRVIKIPCYEKFRLTANAVEKHISPDTIMIFCSAPCYPQGVIDDVESLSELALRYNIGLHVDCCLGGFLLPFAKQLGYDVPKFDFSLKGVMSISCDTHKYGYTPKGGSVVLYRHNELRSCQYFNYAKWSGGMYATPTIAGSRSGGIIACTWASMLSVGLSGYRTSTKAILTSTRSICNALGALSPDIRVLGKDEFKSMIVAFDSPTLNIYEVGDEMKKLGWDLNALQDPPSLHFCVTLPSCGKESLFIKNMMQVVETLREKKSNGYVSTSGNCGLYGTVGSLPSGPIDDIMNCYTSAMLTA